MIWPSDSGTGYMRYEGQYLEDQKHGEGTFTWPSGTVYRGQWVEGKRHGTAVVTDTLGYTTVAVWEADAFKHSVQLDEGGQPTSPKAEEERVAIAADIEIAAERKVLAAAMEHRTAGNGNAADE